jgi:hypothetical protein
MNKSSLVAVIILAILSVNCGSSNHSLSTSLSNSYAGTWKLSIQGNDPGAGSTAGGASFDSTITVTVNRAFALAKCQTVGGNNTWMSEFSSTFISCTQGCTDQPNLITLCTTADTMSPTNYAAVFMIDTPSATVDDFCLWGEYQASGQVTGTSFHECRFNGDYPSAFGIGSFTATKQ